MKQIQKHKKILFIFISFYFIGTACVVKHIMELYDRQQFSELQQRIDQEQDQKLRQLLESLKQEILKQQQSCDDKGICEQTDPNYEFSYPAKLPDKTFFISC